MELDDLKKSWNALDEQLQKDELIDEDKLTQLIIKYKNGARNSIGRITSWQKFSIGAGIVTIAVILLLWCVLPSFISDANIQKRSTILCLFLGITLIAGIGWDLKTYRWIRDTKVDEMPVIIVAERMNRFRRWMKYEIIAISLWTVAFTALYYWMTELYKHSTESQLIIISSLVLIDVVIICFIYKKLIYNHLNEVNKNTNELKELNIAGQSGKIKDL
ncbi:hypothetical protein [uncultured Bacteroides sp.]|uniref:hypothetical protein n=1 Tax=uncultured Bacteroides sp. TaxID=162156 RepID=UPI002AA8C503|nr:hypothetical protein [uncultured Bacteroides sp.]